MRHDETKTDACLEAIFNIGSEQRYLAGTIRAAAKKLILEPKPKKQRRTKNRRPAMDKIAVLQKEHFVSSMRDKVEVKKTVFVERKRTAEAKMLLITAQKAAAEGKKTVAEGKKSTAEAKKP